jgi:hypothetical protein
MIRYFLLAALLGWVVPTVPAQQETPAESSAEAAEKAAEAAEEADKEPPPPRRGGKIMLPGGGAYGASPAPKSEAPTTPVPPPSAGFRSVQPEAPTANRAERPTQTTGDLFWNGRIYKHGRIRISVGNETTAGTVEGDPLPGVAAVVDARSPIVEIIEQPSARNGYKSFEFQVKKTNKTPVTLNFHWAVKP